MLDVRRWMFDVPTEFKSAEYLSMGGTPMRLLFRCPHRRWIDIRSGGFTDVFSAATGEPADDFDLHVLIAEQLAAEAKTGRGVQTAGFEEFLFGDGDFIRFTGDKEHAATGAGGMSAAVVQLVGLSFGFDCVDKPFTGGNFNCISINRELGHDEKLSV
jgi:hypothetical protein